MNLSPLYELKDRLTHIAIAGTSLMEEDFRLARAVEGMGTLAGANPVFARIKAEAEELLTAPAGQRGGKLLDVLSLVDAVVYTQGTLWSERWGTVPPNSRRWRKPFCQRRAKA